MPPRVVSRGREVHACLVVVVDRLRGREDGPAKVGQIDLRWISRAANGHTILTGFDRPWSRPNSKPWRHMRTQTRGWHLARIVALKPHR